MVIDPRIFVAVGDVLLNLSAAWFGAVFILPSTYSRSFKTNSWYVLTNILFGIVALVIGYEFRILEI